MSKPAKPLDTEALEQVRAMLSVPVSGSSQTIVLLMGTARSLLATIDADRGRGDGLVEAPCPMCGRDCAHGRLPAPQPVPEEPT